MERISLKAPAKINLSLRVLGKRPDGYHEIESIMQAIDLYDEISLEKSDIIELTCNDKSLPSDDKNLAFRAASILQGSCYFPGVKIHLEKNIPYGAGLGGGSSDAAFVLRGLCQLYGLKLKPEELAELAARLGSDVPFFLTRGQAIARGRGELLTSISLPTNYKIVLISPSVAISTADVYGALKKSLTTESVVPLLSTKIDFSKFIRHSEKFRNDLEDVVFQKYSYLVDLKRSLLGAGAFYSSMTGSGSSIFGLFMPESMIPIELENLKERNNKVSYCRPILLPSLGL